MNAPLRYGICNELFGDWPLSRACDTAAACGYAGIEIAPFTLAARPADLDAVARGEIRRTIARAGLDCIGLHWLLARTDGFHVTHPDATVRSRTVDHLAVLARRCHDLGGRVLVFGSPKQRCLLPGVTPAAAFDHVREICSRLVPVLEATDTVLAIEPLSAAETDVLTTAADACRLVDAGGSPHGRLHLDIKAMAPSTMASATCWKLPKAACVMSST